MDWDLIERKIKRKVSDLYLNRDANTNPTAYEKRLRSLARQVSAHYSFMKARQKKIDNFYQLMSELHIAKNAFANRKNIIAFDIERSKKILLGADGKPIMGLDKKPARQISEIGISYIDDDKVVTEHYHINGQPIKHPFLYGKTKFIHIHELGDIVKSRIDHADFFVGHNLRNDFSYLEHYGIKMKYKPVFDTSIWSTYMEISNSNGVIDSLSTMAKKFGVHIKQPHNGGNDARYNLLLFMKVLAHMDRFKRIGQTSKFEY